jgi:hypothetical protein
MTIERVTILDYVEFGKRVVSWSLNPETRPKDLAAMKQELRDILVIPDRTTRLSFVEVGLDQLLIRLPNPDMVRESLRMFEKADNAETYPMPLFYRNLQTGGTLSSFDLLFSRIADYTIAQCR